MFAKLDSLYSAILFTHKQTQELRMITIGRYII